MNLADLKPSISTNEYATTTYVDTALNGFNIDSQLPGNVSHFTNDMDYVQRVDDSITIGTVNADTYNIGTLQAETFESVSTTGISKVISSGNITLEAANGAGSVEISAQGLLFPGGGIAQRQPYPGRDAPSSSVGSPGDKVGTFAFDGNYIYTCSSDYDGINNIWGRVALDVGSW